MSPPAALQHQHKSANPQQHEKRNSHQGIFHKTTPLSGYDDGDPRPAQREQIENKVSAYYHETLFLGSI
jgi:hypothetical protein